MLRTVVKALKASLQLRQELPKCRIKLRDAGDETSHQLTSLSRKVCKLIASSCDSDRFAERRLQGRLQPSTLLI